MTMTDQQMGQYVAARAFQLRMLIEGHFLNQGTSCTVNLIDGEFGDNDWLFTPGFTFCVGGATFHLTTRGHISRLKSDDPSDITRWIEGDAGLRTKMSNNDDIIAYENGTSKEIIDKVIGICNDAALPN